MTGLNTRSGWHSAGLALAGLLLLVLVLYRETVSVVLANWNQLLAGEYAHGYLVLAISAWMVISKRRQLATHAPCENALALLAVAVSSLLWLTATLVDVQMVQAFALLLLIMSVIWTITGSRIARQLLMPVLIIGFAIPVWSPLSPLLQELTADVVFWLTRVVGMPALRQDNLIVLPAGSLSIEEACSGMRYLLAALTLGVLYAWLNYQDTRARILVVVIAAAAAVLSNILRVFIVIYLAYTTDMQHPWVSDHLEFGWWLFGGMVMLLIIFDTVLSHHTATRPDNAPSTLVAESGQACVHGNLHRAVVLVLAITLAVSGPVIAGLLERQSNTGPVHVTDWPAGVRGWSGPVPTTDSWMPRYPGAVAGKKAYHKKDYTVLMYIGHYPAQSQGRELVSDMNSLADLSKWELQYTRPRPVSVDGCSVLEQLMTAETGQQRLVWYWYRVARIPTSNKYMAKFLQVYGLFTGHPEASLVAVAIDTGGGVQDSRNRLEDFINKNWNACV